MKDRILKSNVFVYFIDNDDQYIRDVLSNFEDVNDYNVQIYSRSKDFFSDFVLLKPSRKNVSIVFVSTILEMDDNGNPVEIIDVLKKIKQINPKSEVILYSDNDDINLVSSAFHFGAYTFIKKNENFLLRLENNIKGILSQKNFILKKQSSWFVTKLFIIFFLLIAGSIAFVYILFPQWFAT